MRWRDEAVTLVALIAVGLLVWLGAAKLGSGDSVAVIVPAVSEGDATTELLTAVVTACASDPEPTVCVIVLLDRLGVLPEIEEDPT